MSMYLELRSYYYENHGVENSNLPLELHLLFKIWNSYMYIHG